MQRALLRLVLLACAIGLFALPAGAPRILAQDATPCPPMSADDATAWVTSFYAARNAQDQELIASFLSDDFVYHWGIGVDAQGVDEFTSSMTAFMNAFPGLHTTVDKVWVADDTVIVRWINIGIQQSDYMGIPASEQTVTWTGISIFQLECGKAVEAWTEADHFGRIEQQGILPVASPEA
jgi:steroid delta-isomerase-like uncharacterized protein